MKGSKRDRKLLHEHEAFLFGFLVLFVVGGFVFWGYNTNALDYSYGGSDVDEEITLSAKEGTTVYSIITISNKLNEIIIGEDVIILSMDFVCSYDSGSGEDCSDDVVFNAMGPLSLAPGESLDLQLAFSPSSINNGEGSGVLSIFTSEEKIDYISIKLVTFEGSSSDDDIYAIDFGTNQNLVDLFVEKIKLLLEGMENNEESIVYVVDLGENKSVGFTEYSLNFGSDLEVGDGDQKTIIFYLKNTGSEILHLLGFNKPPGYIVTLDNFGNEMFIKKDEMVKISVTFAPVNEGVFSGNLIFNFVEGEVKVPMVGSTLSRDTNGVDEVSPMVDILNPIAGKVSSKFNLEVTATDNGLGVAIMKAYLGKYLVGMMTQPDTGGNTYTAEIDASRFVNSIKTLKVEATDYSGNKGEDEVVVSISRDEVPGDVNDVTVTVVTEDDEDDDTDNNGINTGISPRKKITIVIDKIGVGPIEYGFSHALSENEDELDIKSSDVYMKNVWDNEVIYIGDTVLKMAIDLFDPSSISIPVRNIGDSETITLYNDRGRPYVIEEEDILSKEESSVDGIWNVAIRASVISKAMEA